jgi:transposase
MFLRKIKNKKTGRISLSIVQTYRVKGYKYPKTKTIKSLGYLDELEKEFEDPISHFTEEARILTEQYKQENSSITLEVDPNQKLDENIASRKNLGYAVLSRIYHDLEIDKFLVNRQRRMNFEYNMNTLMKLLVFSRLLYPDSKKATYENRSSFFEKTNYSIDDLYRSLTFLSQLSDDLQIWLHERIKQKYGRDSSLVYYDVTNYYFETDKNDSLRKKGMSKEHRPNPIVQMGLFMDTQGIPISYHLFPGNTHDALTLRPGMSELKRKFNLGKIIVVADKGIISGDNIYHTLSGKNGYVFSMSVRRAFGAFRKYVLDEEGYRQYGEEYRIKSRLEPREIQVTSVSGKKITKTVDEKQVVFYSEKYAKRARAEREKAIEKAMDLINHPGKYTRSTSHGATSYVNNVHFDKETGEILDKGSSLQLDIDKIREEEKLDGYYAIVTSEYKLSDEKIVDIYRGLWKIEESFKVTKSDLETRPVRVSTEDHINAHFLTCYTALVIARILELKTANKYSVAAMMDSLRKASCSHVDRNYYVFDYCDEILKETGDKFGIDFTKKFRTYGEMKKILAASKK